MRGHEHNDPPPTSTVMSPDGVARPMETLPFGFMIYTLEPNNPTGHWSLGESVQATIVRKIWNGSQYVNGDSKDGIDVWNAVVTKLRDMELAFRMSADSFQNQDNALIQWLNELKNRVDLIDKLSAETKTQVGELMERLPKAPPADWLDGDKEALAQSLAGRLRDPGHTNSLAAPCNADCALFDGGCGRPGCTWYTKDEASGGNPADEIDHHPV